MAEWKDTLFLIKHQEILIKMVGKETKLQIKFQNKKSAPDKDLEFVSCNCKKADT